MKPDVRSWKGAWGKSFDFLPAYSFVKMRVEEKGPKVKKCCVFLASVNVKSDRRKSYQIVPNYWLFQANAR